MKRKNIVLLALLALIVFTFFGCSKTNESLESREDPSVAGSSQPEEKTLFSLEPENIEKIIYKHIDGRIGEIRDERLQEIAEKFNGFTYTESEYFGGADGWTRTIEIQVSGKDPMYITLRDGLIEYDGVRYYSADPEYFSEGWFDQYLPSADES